MDLEPRRDASSVQFRSCVASVSGRIVTCRGKGRRSVTSSMTCCRTISSMMLVVSTEDSPVSPETYIICRIVLIRLYESDRLAALDKREVKEVLRSMAAQRSLVKIIC